METLGTLLERQALENKNKPYLYFLDREISYENMNAGANQMANVFNKLGVTKGDHVVILLPQCPEYIYCWFGLAKLGAVTVTINTQFRGEPLEHLIKTSDSKFAVVASDFLPQYEEIAPKIKGIKRITFDTTGAGDAFTAALTVSLVSGIEPQAALERACLAGALTTTKMGAQSSPSAADIAL